MTNTKERISPMISMTMERIVKLAIYQDICALKQFKNKTTNTIGR